MGWPTEQTDAFEPDERNADRWSTRYYRADCDDVAISIKTHGDDDRPDPGPDLTVQCLVPEHGQHPLVRISPRRYEELTADADDDAAAVAELAEAFGAGTDVG